VAPLACMDLGVDISPSTQTLNYLCERNDRLSLTKLVENGNLGNLWSKPGCHRVSKAVDI
jgi:hypothetical protein